MDAYFGAKQRLFSELLKPDSVKPSRTAVVNLDDEYGPRVADAAACRVITFGRGDGADVTATGVTSSLDGISGDINTPKGKFSFTSKLVGSYNLSNILGAVAVGVALGISLEDIRSGIEGHKAVPGRLERVDNIRGVRCLVDYAHTGDALENVLSTLKEIATGRIITVFGCGGDRDRGKRPVMGGIAARYSDLAIVTSDNPRTENPASILSEIKAGISGHGIREYRPEELGSGITEKGFVVIENRREAIRMAASVASSGDILLLAGKGHEDYQIIGTTKHHFDDREEAAAALEGATVV
jgi:UDP-N-acetylmuramoyl-L-alanyl-D-glutamate--2,6-diaminopimelate ligase